MDSRERGTEFSSDDDDDDDDDVVVVDVDVDNENGNSPPVTNLEKVWIPSSGWRNRTYASWVLAVSAETS